MLLIEDILHHLGCINLVNNGINYLSTGAQFFYQQYVYVYMDGFEQMSPEPMSSICQVSYSYSLFFDAPGYLPLSFIHCHLLFLDCMVGTGMLSTIQFTPTSPETFAKVALDLLGCRSFLWIKGQDQWVTSPVYPICK